MFTYLKHDGGFLPLLFHRSQYGFGYHRLVAHRRCVWPWGIPVCLMSASGWQLLPLVGFLYLFIFHIDLALVLRISLWGYTGSFLLTFCLSLLYSFILRSRAHSLRSHVILHEWIDFVARFLNIHRSGVFTTLAWLVPHETAAFSARSVYTIQPCTMSLHAKLRCMRI